jgi:hypothetical protein
MRTVKELMDNNDKKNKEDEKERNKEFKNKIKEREKICKIIVEKMILYIENYLIENKDIIFTKLVDSKYVYLDIKLPQIWKEIYEIETNDKIYVFRDRNINIEDLSEYNKYTFYDLELSKVFFKIMSKYLLNRKELVKNEIYKGCTIYFLEDYFEITTKSRLLIDRENSISVRIEYENKSKICPIM